MKQTILKAKCKSCGKEIYSLYKKQLDYNLKAHELTCKKQIKQKGSDRK